MTSPLVTLSGASFRYGSDVVLEGVDLEIAIADRLAVLGPNGGGKTTLARLLLGLANPSSGSAAFARPLRERRFGYVPQSPSFERSFPLRLQEMVAGGLLRDRRSRSAGERARAAARMLEELDLVDRREAYLDELSGGELRRALVARALIGEPDLLVLDEPTASLDEPSRHRLWKLLAALPDDTAIVLVTHDLAPGTFLPTRALLVDRRIEPLAVPELHDHPLLCSHDHG